MLDGKAVEGMVGLGSMYDHDPYSFPYMIELHCTDPNAPCSFSGELNADGTLVSQPGDPAFTMTETGVATCQ